MQVPKLTLSAWAKAFFSDVIIYAGTKAHLKRMGEGDMAQMQVAHMEGLFCLCRVCGIRTHKGAECIRR